MTEAASYNAVRVTCKGMDDDIDRDNTEIREAIHVVSRLFDSWPNLQLLPAEGEAHLLEALKLYRDMNHLSLAGGITCEQAAHRSCCTRTPPPPHHPRCR